MRAIFKEDRDVRRARALTMLLMNRYYRRETPDRVGRALKPYETDNRATGGSGPATGPPTRLQHSRKLPI